MDHLLFILRSEHSDDILDADLQMRHIWLVFSPYSKFYTVLTICFHKYGRKNVKATNYLSHWSTIVLVRENMKLFGANKIRTKYIGNILCQFPYFLFIYPMGPIYYCQGRPSNTPYHWLSLNFIFNLKILHSNLLNTVTLWTLKYNLGGLNIWHIIIQTICRFYRFQPYMVSRKTFTQLIHHLFGCASIPILCRISKKLLM